MLRKDCFHWKHSLIHVSRLFTPIRLSHCINQFVSDCTIVVILIDYNVGEMFNKMFLFSGALFAAGIVGHNNHYLRQNLVSWSQKEEEKKKNNLIVHKLIRSESNKNLYHEAVHEHFNNSNKR